MTDVIKDINKKFGDGSIFKLGDREVVDIESFSTGILGLDAIIGIKGFPVGRITEILGNPGTGKTSLCLSACADAQRKCKKVAFIDMEHSLDREHATKLGVSVDDMFVSQPSNGNEALAIAKLLIESDEFSLVVIDSIAALLPEQEEAQEDFGNSNVGLHARLMAQACRKLTPLANKHNVALVFTNQYRTNIASFGYGDNSIGTGGNSMKFFASLRIELKRLNQIKEGDDVVGHIMQAKTSKNKQFRPFMEYQYPIYYNSSNIGVDEVINLAIDYGFIKKAGAWFTVDGNKLQGLAKVRAYLLENVTSYDVLRKKIIDALEKYVIRGEKRDKVKLEDEVDS